MFRCPVVLGEKTFHKGFLHLMMESGGEFGVGMFSVRFIREDDMIKIQYLCHGIDADIKTQIWKKPEPVVEKIDVIQEAIVEELI